MSDQNKPTLSPVLITGLAIVVIAGVALYTYHLGKTNTPPSVANTSSTPTTSPTSTPTPTLTSIDTTWNKYTNTNLGFSLKLPKVTTIAACQYDQSANSYYATGTQNASVLPFEESGDVIIANSTFAKLSGETQLSSGASHFSGCANAPVTISAIKDSKNLIFNYWTITVKAIKSDDELDSFIKTTYGSGCSLGTKTATSQSGVYDVSINGDGKDLGTTDCPVNYATVIKYSPSLQKVAQWNMGQSVSFSEKDTVYDFDMKNSFTFL